MSNVIQEIKVHGALDYAEIGYGYRRCHHGSRWQSNWQPRRARRSTWACSTTPLAITEIPMFSLNATIILAMAASFGSVTMLRKKC